jgi:hypothetical protein
MNFEPFFLTGAPKSGTTWLGKLLEAHPEINCRGEACVHHFALELLKACRSYGELLDRRRLAVTDSNDFPGLPWTDVLALMRRFIELRLAAIVDPAKTGLKFVGEKDPEHAMHFATLDKLFPEGKFIHIIRDGRAVFISAWHHNVRSKDVNLKTLGFNDFLDITAKEWSGRVRRGRETGQPLGDRYFEIRYEDLHADTAGWFTKTLDFLGAESTPETVAACVQAASFETLSQGRKQGEGDEASFFRKGIPDDWRTQLSPAQARRFDVLSGGLLGELGYGD